MHDGVSLYLQAGLCSQETCGNLQEASVLWGTLPNEKDPDKLSLALEPQCAAIYCQSMSSKQQVAPHCQAEMPYKSTCYLVVDIGGGTVDISAHRLSPTPDRHVQAVHPPTGNDCGGSKVNKNFENFLESLVDDKGFSKYLQSKNPVTNAKHSADLNELVNRIFEDQKVIFGRRGGIGSRTDSRLTIRLPFSFFDMYKDDINNGIKRMIGSRLKLVDQDLRIEYSLMADFFQPVVEGMLECMSQTLREMEAKINTIYLVGGFGGSQYIYKRITERFGDTYRYVTPLEPDFAVIRGAVLFRQNPDIVRARKADATYGVRTVIPFDPQIHDTEYKWINDDGEEKCLNTFYTVVERGDLVCTEELFSSVFGPPMHQQTNLCFEIYSTLEKDVWYTTGKRGKGSQDTAPVELRKIGAFVVQMPVLTGDKNRHVDVTFDFGHTEIQVKGYDRTSGNEVKVTLDFLSA